MSRTASERSRGDSSDAGRFRAIINLIAPAHFRRLLSAVVALFATASWACAGDIINVEIFDKPPCFRPADPIIKVGTTVKWTNEGETVHTVTADPSQAPDPSWVAMPPGAEEMDSGYMNAGDSFSYEFKIPGVYKYFCLTHEQEGMRGEIDVKE